mmetsp:Transcript_14638/g.38814  ORF Transcript_14638/g.38814 Transcript_14638/m.38814 type:complete len:236 (+) Transcript_14638:45-752(+)
MLNTRIVSTCVRPCWRAVPLRVRGGAEPRRLAQHSWPLERLAPALIYQPQLQIAVKLAHHAPLRRTRTCIPIAAISSSGSSSSSSSSSSPSPRNLVFKLHKIVGDGSCQFRAIVQGVQYATSGSLLSPQSEALAAQNLRLKVVQELSRNKEFMEPFIAGITDNWEGYLQRMADPNVWGGEPELVMAVNVIRRPITVHHIVDGAATPIVTYGEELGMAQAVHLLWSTVHYDLLIPE